MMLIGAFLFEELGRLYLFVSLVYRMSRRLIAWGVTLANLPYTCFMIHSLGATPTVKNMNSRVLRPREPLRNFIDLFCILLCFGYSLIRMVLVTASR